MKKFIKIGGLFLVVIFVLVFGFYKYYKYKITHSAALPEFVATAPSAGTTLGSITTKDGLTRQYVIHIPTGYSKEKRYPLVFLFHGGRGTADKILAHTQFVPKADAEGFIVVAPQGINNTWNNGLTHEKFPERNSVDDVAFTRELVADLQEQLPIDKTRIYATGPSNGGMMTERLGCEASDLFAAVASDVGPPVTTIAATCHPHPIPVLGIQGGADLLVPIGGGELTGIAARYGEGGDVLSAKAAMEMWAQINGCTVTPTVTRLPTKVADGTSVDQYTFSSCTKELVYYIVEGMGHGWPPNKPRSPDDSGAPSGNLNATDVIWDFFARHHK